MGAELDRLEIQIEAEASKANRQLNNLAGKLEKVSNALSGLNRSGLAGLSDSVSKFAQASAQLSNVKTADFNRLTKNIEKLSSLNTQQIYGASSAMHTLATAMNSLGNSSKNSTQVTQLTTAISQLGSANAQKAAANLPALANAMNSFMATLAKAPQVSNNVIYMTNSLAKLASQGAKVGSSGKSLTTSINRIGTSMERTTKKTRSLSSVMGSFYQSYFWVSNGVKKLWSSIESSMGYVETLNYFNAAFGQVADSAVSQWEEAGADSAQSYYESFGKRALQLTEKMTGFTVRESGMLEVTGGKSLGINPSQLMNYQAMFAQMSNSMGITAETSLKLSTALTEIGADLASVKNMDFDKVWTDMASGLAGMSRTLDKYGVNIRNVNLQQKLMELGINANITALNQNEKALLRTIILLDSTRYAWGDLADTIDQPANQLRLLRANFSNLARTIGNIFLPIVAKVLPYLNAVVIALQRLGEWIVKLLGFEDFEWGGSSGIGGSEFDNLLGSIEDTEEGLNDATAAAKKLKTNLLGIDELNIINQEEDTGSSGIGGSGINSGLLEGALDKILEEYQKAWDEAFANMEERFDDFAENVAEAYKKNGLWGVGDYLSQSLSRIFEKIDWEPIYEGARTFGTGLADFLNGFISPRLFGNVGKIIANSLNTAIYTSLSFAETFDFYEFGESLAWGINDFFYNFDFAALADALNSWVDGLGDAIAGFLNTLKWEDIIDKVGDFLGNLEFDTAAIIGLITIKKIAKTIISEDVIAAVGAAISKKIASGIGKFLGIEIAQNAGIGTALLAAGGAMANILLAGFSALLGNKAAISALSFFSPILVGLTGISSVIGGVALAVSNFFSMWENGWNLLGEILKDVGIALAAVGAVILGVPATVAAVVAGIVAVVSTAVILIKDNWDSIKETFSKIADVISEKWGKVKEITSKIFYNIKSVVTETWNNVKENTFEFLENVKTNFSEKWESIRSVLHEKLESIKSKLSDVWDNLKRNTLNFLNNIRDYFVEKWELIKSKLSEILENIKKKISDVWENIKTKTLNFLNNVKTYFTEKWDAIKSKLSETLENIKTKVSSVWENIKSKISEILENIKSKVSDVWENIKSKISEILENIKSKVSDVWENIKTKIANVVSSISTTVSGKFEAIKKAISDKLESAKSVINSFKDAISNAITKITEFFGFSGKDFSLSLPTDIFGRFADAISGAVGKLKELFGYDGKSVNVSSRINNDGSVQAYATGGFPNVGDIFIANEMGPELIGTINGRTAVGSGQEITGIREAVYDTGNAQTQLLGTAIELLRIIADKDPSVSIDGRELVNAYDARKARNGYSFT